MADFLKYISKCEEMRKKFLKEKDQISRETLVKEFVNYLEKEGLSAEEIEEILNIEDLLEAQGNSQMITNNKSYKEAVAKALGGN